MINKTWELDRAREETPKWGLLVESGGTAVIPLLLNPLEINRRHAARTKNLDIYGGQSRVVWMGNNAPTYSVKLIVTDNYQVDISPVLDSLQDTIGRVWFYTHGQRVTPPLLMTTVNCSETRWASGKPIYATVDLNLITVGPPPVVVSDYKELTRAGNSDIVRQAIANGYAAGSVRVDYAPSRAQGSTSDLYLVYSANILIGYAKDGIFIEDPLVGGRLK